MRGKSQGWGPIACQVSISLGSRARAQAERSNAKEDHNRRLTGAGTHSPEEGTDRARDPVPLRGGNRVRDQGLEVTKMDKVPRHGWKEAEA